MNSQRS